MKTGQFIIFLSVVLSIYTLAGYYIYARGIQALNDFPQFKLYFRLIFTFLFLSYIIARILDTTEYFAIADVFNTIGAWWLAAILYLILFILAIDLLRVVNYYFSFFPGFILDNLPKAKLYTFITVICSVALILIIGRINSITPKFNELTIKINKKVSGEKTLNLVLASDLHIGPLVPEKRVKQLVEMINSKNPDIVILAGDLLDEVLNPVFYYDMGKDLKNIKSKFGVFAVLGNHEYIGGYKKSIEYIKSLGINLLIDSSVLIDNKFYLIGRDDKESLRFSGHSRKELNELLTNINKEKPTILIDHQPFKLDLVADAGIDLQLSGHTHNGQLYPLSFIPKMIFQIPVGYGKINNSQFYVSPGYGTWGPPIRLGSRPEVAVIKIEFDN